MGEELSWTRSSFCESNGCVEVAIDHGVTYVKADHGPEILVFTAEEWQAFIAGVKAGEFDL